MCSGESINYNNNDMIFFEGILFIIKSILMGELLNFYELIPWWDVMLHAEAGALIYVVIYNRIKGYTLMGAGKRLMPLALLAAIGVGALWEIFEYTMDVNFGWSMQKSGLRDTIWDLIAGGVGAGLAMLFYTRIKSYTQAALDKIRRR